MPRTSDAQRRIIELETRLEYLLEDNHRLKKALEDERQKNHEITLQMLKQGKEAPLDFSRMAETAPNPEADKQREKDAEEQQKLAAAEDFWFEGEGYSIAAQEEGSAN